MGRALSVRAAGLCAALVAAAFVASCAAQATGGPCRWVISSTRPRVPADQQLSLRVPYARTSDSQRELPGPDSMRLVARNEANHPKVFLQDLRRGRENSIVDTWSFRPEWSPDGRWVACIAWNSPARQRQLTIVDWRRGKRV